MLERGVYPAAVTPFDEKGRVDVPGVAKLLAWFEAAGCNGVVLAGTNGEGPSLSAVEKRDLLQAATSLRGSLELVLGVATPSLDEAIWLCKQAANSSAAAVLVMPPSYFREATEEGIFRWFWEVLEKSPSPVLIYNFPKRTGVTISPAMMERLGRHSNMIGAKDSSGEVGNLTGYRSALSSEKLLYVGDETLLFQALEARWTGTMSGAANVVPEWLVRVVSEYHEEGWRESAETKFELLLPVLQAIRSQPQPAGNKAVLESLGVLPSRRLRLPLNEATPESTAELVATISARLGAVR